MTHPADAHVPPPWQADVEHLRHAAAGYADDVCRAVRDGYADMPFVTRHAAAAIGYLEAAQAAADAWADAVTGRAAA